MRGAIARIVVCTAVFTGGCGVKGPLYVPGVPRDAPWPYRTSKPAPTASSPAPAPAPAQGGAPGAAPEGKP